MKERKTISLDAEVVHGIRCVMAALLREGKIRVSFSDTINGVLANNLVANSIIENYREEEVVKP